MKYLLTFFMFLSISYSDNLIFDLQYHEDNTAIKKITYYKSNNNKIELSRIEFYWASGQKYSETYHVNGLKYKEILWYENGQRGMECKELDIRGVNCKYWKRDGTSIKEEELSNSEENELFLEFRNLYF